MTNKRVISLNVLFQENAAPAMGHAQNHSDHQCQNQPLLDAIATLRKIAEWQKGDSIHDVTSCDPTKPMTIGQKSKRHILFLIEANIQDVQKLNAL